MQRIPILYALLFGVACQAQTNPASQKALSLRTNVVFIKATQDVGFGFITGEKEGELYIVTAAHVIINGDKPTKSVEVQFYQNQGFSQAEVVLHNDELDVALLKVIKPSNLKWQSNVRGTAEPGKDAAFIGRSGDWYVPLGVALGTVNRLNDLNIYIDINSVLPGTSGAPAITESGMVGLILGHNGAEAEVLNLSDIKLLLRKESLPFQLTFEQYGLVGDTLYDEDGNEYPTKVMKDDKRWMTKNLNVEIENSWCYQNNPTYCEKYGRLYTWEAAKEACVEFGDGWRLPTVEEWSNLKDAFGNPKKAYKALIEGGSSGFAAQLGGWRYSGGAFDNAGASGYYWSSSPSGSSGAWYYHFFRYDGQLYRYDDYRDGGHSIRCLQDL